MTWRSSLPPTMVALVLLSAACSQVVDGNASGVALAAAEDTADRDTTGGGAEDDTTDDADADDDAAADGTTPTATVTARRGDLSEERGLPAQLGHGDQWTIALGGEGTVTTSRAAGDRVGVGDELVRVDDRPVTLAEGDVPLYRELALRSTSTRDEAGDRVGLMTGDDVRQLQRFLLDAGFDDDGRLADDGEFGPTTERAVEDWQRAVGHPATGRVDGRQLVFSPQPLRIAADLRAGAAAQDVSVTSTTPQVTVQLGTRDRILFAVGAEVDVELDEERTVAGVVREVQRVSADDGGQVTQAVVDVADAPADAPASVRVVARRTLAQAAVLVPVNALLALAEGGWAVEVVDGDGPPTLTLVELVATSEETAAIEGVDEDATLVVPS